MSLADGFLLRLLRERYEGYFVPYIHWFVTVGGYCTPRSRGVDATLRGRGSPRNDSLLGQPLSSFGWFLITTLHATCGCPYLHSFTIATC